MSAFPLSWHRDNLKNLEASLAREEIQLLEQEQRTIRLRHRVNFAEQQLTAAKYEGKESFDPERYLKAQRPPGI